MNLETVIDESILQIRFEGLTPASISFVARWKCRTSPWVKTIGESSRPSVLHDLKRNGWSLRPSCCPSCLLCADDQLLQYSAHHGPSGPWNWSSYHVTQHVPWTLPLTQFIALYLSRFSNRVRLARHQSIWVSMKCDISAEWDFRRTRVWGFLHLDLSSWLA